MRGKMKHMLLAGILAAMLAMSACGADPDTTVSDSDVKQESVTDSVKSEKAEESRKTADKKKDTEESIATKKDSKEDSKKKESEKESAKTETTAKSSSTSDKPTSGQKSGSPNTSGSTSAKPTSGNQNASSGTSSTNTGSQPAQPSAPSGNDNSQPVQPSSPSGNGGSSKPSQPETPAHTHNYSKSVTDATCTSDGKIIYTCACSEEYSETIPALGHAYQASITAQASCGSAGTKTFTCSRCNDSYTESIPATEDHSWKDIYEDHWHDPVTEERPVYEEHTICNQCGMDFGASVEGNDAAIIHVATTPGCQNYSVKRVQTGTERVTIQEGYTSHDYVRTECSVCHTVK